MRKIITEQAAKIEASKYKPLFLSSFIYQPAFPEKRRDVCVVIMSSEDNYGYGYSTALLVWRDRTGALRSREICNTKTTKDYINFRSIRAEGSEVTVLLDSGGAYSGKPWSRIFCLSLTE